MVYAQATARPPVGGGSTGPYAGGGVPTARSSGGYCPAAAPASGYRQASTSLAGSSYTHYRTTPYAGPSYERPAAYFRSSSPIFSVRSTYVVGAGPSVVFRDRAPTVIVDRGRREAVVVSPEKESAIALATLFGVISLVFVVLLGVAARNYNLGIGVPYSARGLLIASAVITPLAGIACLGFSIRSCQL
jgi:hypothetical protein